MGAFGGESDKGMKLYGTAPFLRCLEAALPKDFQPRVQLTVSTVLSSGKQSVSGSSELKASQAYPRRFGFQVAQAFHDHWSSGGVCPAGVDINLDHEDRQRLLEELCIPSGL